MGTFMQTLDEQRWDDHRLYHHSTINQALHLLSATAFLVAYVLLFIDPASAALVGWLVSMVSRQAGHFFFEPRTYDTVNQISHERKEEIKVGYNLQRKTVLMAAWLAGPVALLADPTFFGTLQPATDLAGYAHQVGLIWLALGAGALLGRTLQLFIIRDVKTGLVWMTKILTDPLHDIYLYHKAPLHLWHGRMIDPDAPQAQRGGLGSTMAGRR